MKSLLFKTFTLAIGLMLMVMLMPIPSVSARAELESCTPAVDAVLTQAPDHVQCTFTEPVDIARSTLAVFDANNNQVDSKDTKLDAADAEGQTLVVSLDKAKLTNGVYKVKWATVSKEDQALGQGEWSFTLNLPAGAPAAPTAAPTAPAAAPAAPTAAPSAPSAAPTTTAPSGAPSGPAQAPAPAAAALSFRDDPGAAATFGTAVQSMPARSVQWFSFNYDTAGYQFPRPTVTVRLLNGVTNGLGFEVWSPERMQGGWWENKPVGRGTQQVLPSCEEPEEEGGEGEVGAPEEGTPPGEEVPPGEGVPEEARLQDQVTGSFVSWTFAVECGKFVTNDLTWSGGFGAGGTYYVRLINPTNAPIIPQMLISGAGVTECANANLGLPGYGLVPSPDEAFVRVQCIDAGPGLVYTDVQPEPGPEDEEGGDE